jgi:transposase
MERFIGLDVHAASTTCAVIDAKGKHLRAEVVETNGQALVEFLKLQPGTLRLCMEEGTQSAWLTEILKPHVAQLAVIHVHESRGPKNDERDAFALAEQMRMGKLEHTVYKEVGPFAALRQLAKTHAMIVQDSVRIQSRIKAIFRSRGVPVAGKSIYASDDRAMWIAKLPASSQEAARLLFAEYDAQATIRAEAEKKLVVESHRHPITRVLETCPGLGPIRVAQLVAIVVTPDRFRTRAQFWSYCGLGLVMRSSSDWVKQSTGDWRRKNVMQTRGLNYNHNHTLKNVFKGAATTVVTQLAEHPLGVAYKAMLDGGTKPNLAKVSLARKIASITLSMWKNKEVYDTAKRTTKPSS